MDLVEELNSKITKTYVDTELGKKASQSALASKTDKTYVDTELKKKADQSALIGKADKTYVDTELGKKADQSALATKANVSDIVAKADLESQLAGKATTEDVNQKVDKTYVDTELGKKADQSALDSKANITDIIPKSDLETMLDAKVNKSELESGGSKEYVDNELGKKADKSEIEELRKQIENLQKDNRKLSKSIYVEAVLTTAIKPWTATQSSFEFKNLKIEHNTDDLGKSNAKSFTFTAAQEQNYLIDASITIKFGKETSGILFPTFIYKIQVFKGDKWQKSEIMQWQYNGVTQKPNKASKDISSIGTLKSTDIIHLQKDERMQFILECKSLAGNWNDISIQLPTSFLICSLN